MAEADKLYQSYDLPHNNWLNPDTFLVFGGSYKIWSELCKMVMLFIAVCLCRVDGYKLYKWTLFRLLHQNRVQNIIQYHDNNIWKQMCLKMFCYRKETYFWYYVQGGNPGQNLHESSTSWIGPIPKNYELFPLCTREWDRRGHVGLEPI